MERFSRGMKTIAEVLDLRNSLLMNFENALTAQSDEERDMLMSIVIIGGGPSGVEIAGALAEMNKYVLKKDYPEFKEIRAKIYLIEAVDRVLSAMTQKSSDKARGFLEKMGVQVLTGTKATGCDEKTVYLDSNGSYRILSLAHGYFLPSFFFLGGSTDRSATCAASVWLKNSC